MMNQREFMRRFLEDVVKQNEEQLKGYFQEDAVILWPCTNEQFTVRDYIIANCQYPGEWKGELVKVTSLKESLVAVSKVSSTDFEIFVTSFVTFSEGKIQRLEEYWADIGNPPEWRKALKIGTIIN